MNKNELIDLLDDLQKLLEEQIQNFRKSNYRDAETSIKQAGDIINKFRDSKIPEQPEFKQRFERLTKLYKNLILMVSAQKSNIDTQMHKINNATKTLNVYSTNS
ncbi:hypothetical protein ACFL3G_07550 [Planctomycetota bacterium]